MLKNIYFIFFLIILQIKIHLLIKSVRLDQANQQFINKLIVPLGL